MKRLLPWMITMLLAITLIALVFIMVWNSQNSSKPSEGKDIQIQRLSADEILKVTSVMTNIRTNLATPDQVVQISLAFQLDSEKTFDQFEKIKDIKIKPVILKILADTTKEELSGTKGLDQLCAKLLEQINKTLPQGKVIQIEVTEYITTRI